jgi:hypothetical protein
MHAHGPRHSLREAGASRRVALWLPGFTRPKAIEALLAAVKGMNNPICHLIETQVEKGE